MTFKPILLSEPSSNVEQEVKCIRHMFDNGYMVLQFEVKNNLKPSGGYSSNSSSQNMSHVYVRVVASDEDLYNIEKEIELPYLPFTSTGSCYVVLKEKRMIEVNSSFSCDLYYDDNVIPLQNIEINSEN